MDGIRRITFRVRHDCPLARLSRDLPDGLHVWSGHRMEVVQVRARRGREAAVRTLLNEHLRAHFIRPTEQGFLAAWRPPTDPKTSISRIIEEHGLMWQQPLWVEDGWEHYDALSFGGDEQGALDALRAGHPTQVVRREDVEMGAVAAGLFMSLAPAMEAPTDKQAEALVAAFESGYYRSPRAVTTAQVAGGLGITRSSFEERLRNGENKVMAALLPHLEWARR